MTDVTKPIVKNDEDDSYKEPTAEVVRTEIIEKHGLDEDIQPELIDSLVEERLESNKKLSTAIRQKIELRDKNKDNQLDNPTLEKDDFTERYNEMRKKEADEARKKNQPLAVTKLLKDFPDLNDEANWGTFKKQADRLNLESSQDGIYGQYAIIAKGLGYQTNETVLNTGMGYSTSATRKLSTVDDDVKMKSAELRNKANDKVMKIAKQFTKGPDAYFEDLAKNELDRESQKKDRYI